MESTPSVSLTKSTEQELDMEFGEEQEAFLN